MRFMRKPENRSHIPTAQLYDGYSWGEIMGVESDAKFKDVIERDSDSPARPALDALQGAIEAPDRYIALTDTELLDNLLNKGM